MSLKVGDKVIYKTRSGTGYGDFEGVIEEKLSLSQAVVYFPDGLPSGHHAAALPLSILRPVPQWERVEGKVRAVHDDGINHVCTSVCHENGKIICRHLLLIYFERLV